jgi:hypothetical protein
MKPDLQHSMLLSLRNTTSVLTLTELFIGFMPEAMDAIVYIDDFKSLISLDVAFRDAMFQRPFDCKPWDLPRLNNLRCWPMNDAKAQCCQYFAECNFPVLVSLRLQYRYKPDSWLQLYRSKAKSLKEFYVHLDDEEYISVLPHLTGIECLVVERGRPLLVPALPTSVTRLRLRCRDMETVTNIYSIFDLLLDGRSHSVKIIRIEFIAGPKFQWVSEDEDKPLGASDGSIHRGNFKQRLVQYMSKGLVILDDDDKSLLDYIPWR